MEIVWQEIVAELGDVSGMLRVTLRLALAVVLGSCLGLQRERAGQPAGWRTHILVTMAAAIFVMAIHESGGGSADISRVIQGVATGIGFVGAGAILKMADRQRVTGLTTAASVWLAAANGVAIGVGRIWLPLVGSVFGWLTLAYLRALERRLTGEDPNHDA
jgi:putative Mg2+ transporter-C (MgtC) family protein